MNRLLCVVVGLAATFMAVPVAAQTAQCSQAQPVVTGLLDDMSKRLEAARLTNSAAAMRDAADDVQSALLDVRSQLAPCAQMEVAAGNAHAGHAMPGIAPAPQSLQAPQAAPTASAPVAVDPHAGHLMPAQPAARPAASPGPAPRPDDAHAGHATPVAPAGASATRPAPHAH